MEHRWVEISDSSLLSGLFGSLMLFVLETKVLQLSHFFLHECARLSILSNWSSASKELETVAIVLPSCHSNYFFKDPFVVLFSIFTTLFSEISYRKHFADSENSVFGSGELCFLNIPVGWFRFMYWFHNNAGE